jgi:REP element-mobilizing transposase RayT
MAQTLFSAYFHIVFSTKDRVDLIPAALEQELYAYIGGVLRGFECVLLAAGGTSNHVHLLVSVGKNRLVPEIIGAVKRDSSKWIKTKGSEMIAKFAWQDGYSAFTVGHTQIGAIKKYVAGQKEHHAKQLFEEEMRGFYRRYEMNFDEDYVWG